MQLSELAEAVEVILNEEEKPEKESKPYPRVVMRVLSVDYVVGEVVYDEETDQVYILPA